MSGSTIAVETENWGTGVQSSPGCREAEREGEPVKRIRRYLVETVRPGAAPRLSTQVLRTSKQCTDLQCEAAERLIPPMPHLTFASNSTNADMPAVYSALSIWARWSLSE